MERCYYNAATLRADLAGFERRYGMTSAEFFAYRGIPESVDGHDAFVWADLYREWRRLTA